MRKSLLLVLAVVLVAGCTQQTEFENNGIKITQFIANPTDASEGQGVEFSLELENVGSTTATAVSPELINVQNVWGGDTGAKSSVTMRPGSVRDNTPGDIRFFQWSAIAPDLPEGVVAPLKVKARVTYDYSTTQAIIIKALNRDQKTVLESKGEILIDAISIAQDDFSPLKVSVSKGPIPLLIDPEDPTLSDVTYKLDIVNVGDGFPTTGGEIGFVSGTIEARGPGIAISECSSGSGNFNSEGVTLRSDGAASIICTVSIDKGTWSTGPKGDSFLITLELTYTYFVEKEVIVTVHGRGAASGGGTPGGGTPGGGSTPSGGLTFCNKPADSQSTVDKCNQALTRKGDSCPPGGNWCIEPFVSDEYCCALANCGSTVTIQRDAATCL